MDEILKLLSIHDGKGNFALEAGIVAEAQNKSPNAVYTSRRGQCKLDKLTAFDMIKKLIIENENKKVSIAGDKAGIIDGLNGVLKEGTRYEIFYKEV